MFGSVCGALHGQNAPMPNRDATPFRAISAHTALLPADASSEGTWLQLLPAGEVTGRDGRGPYVVGDEAAMAAIVAKTLDRAKATDISVDYDHQAIFAAVPGVGGSAPAAGWIKELQVRPDGIWGRVEWTAAAAEKIRAGEYRYLSPVFRSDQTGRVEWIFNAGLTNTPNFDLEAVAASDRGFTQEHDMKSIAAELGLAEGASEDAILAAVRTLKGTNKAVADAVGLSAASTAEALTAAITARGTPDPAKFVPMDQHLAVQTELTALKATTVDEKATAAVDQAVKDGKIAPASKDSMLAFAKADPKGFETFVASAPAIVAKGGTAKGQPDKSGELDDAQLTVCRALGISADEFKKSRDQEAR